MQVAELTEHGLPEDLVTAFLEKGIEELNPPQRSAVRRGVLDGESMIVSSPTASGKTLIATMAISRTLQRGKKALYLVPLKALASEKYQEFQELFGDEYDVAMSVGDRDRSGHGLGSKDLIVMTVEKLDAVLRHGPSWIRDVDLVVEDEIHLLNSESRGPTLEVTLTRLRELMEFQLLGLSATIKNDRELATWLEAELVASDYRPVTLKEGIFWQDEIEFYLNADEVDPEDGTGAVEGPADDSPFTTAKAELEQESVEDQLETEHYHVGDRRGRPTMDLIEDGLKHGNQAITFVRSRKSAESEAERAGKVVSDYTDREEQQELEELADDVRSVLGNPTEQCKRLARCVEKGTAFHHAGLVSQQRNMIEDAFRDDLIKSISATPTLAAGVSLPAYRIIIRDVKRYTNSGLSFIPVLEYKQMAGRAGRPEHHDEGQAIAVAKNSGMKTDIRDRYILGDAEEIYSKLAVEPVLRMHVLSLIATRFTQDFDELKSFFSKTFYAQQYGNIEEIAQKLQGVTEDLEEYGFIDITDDSFRPTKLGKRVAELYIDPDSAHHMLETVRDTVEEDRDRTPLGLLHMLAQTVEMKPLLRLRNEEKLDLEDLLQTAEDQLLTEAPQPWDDYRYEGYMKAFKTALMLQSWINEEDEDEMMDQYNVTPGGIRAKVENADWLLYGLEEMCTLQDWTEARTDVKKLRTRLKHGINEELLRLVRFKGIGRVRARRLYDADIRDTSDIREAGFTKLKKLLGRKTAEKLKEQVGDDDFFDKENIMDYMGKD